MDRKEFEEAARRLLANIRKNTPGLYLPIRRSVGVERLGPRLAVYKTYSEVSAAKDSPEKYWQLLNEVPFIQAFGMQSAINLILAGEAIDLKTHEALNQNFVRDEYLRQPSELQKEGGPQPDIEVVFTRAGVLANYKAMLAIGTGKKAEDFDRHLSGDLTLLCNDYLGSTKLKAQQQIEDIDLLLEFLPTWELDNPRDVAYGLARVVRMLKTHLPGNDAVVAKARELIGLDPAKLTFDELSLDDYIAAIFGLYAHSASLTLEAVFKNPSEGVIDPGTFVSKTKFPQELLEKFLATRSLSPDEFKVRITEGRKWENKEFSALINSDEFGANTLLFKTYPLLQWSNGRTLILDSQYVSEILIYGLYWRVVDGLDVAKREIFISLWGRLLELQLYDLLDHYYPHASGILSKDVPYLDGQIDALLDYGPDIILFEFKASMLRDDTKHKRERERFEAEMRRKFIENEKGAPKALRQLANAAAAIRKQTVKTAANPKRIFPVFVGYEPTLETFSMNSYLHERFRPFISRDENEICVLPLTVMSVDEFEGVLPHIEAGIFTWPELLNERFDHDRVRAFSIHQTVYDLCRKKGAEIRRNQFLLDQFEAIFNDVASRYQEPGEKT